jgi:predicted phage-related endonuclease
MRSDLIYTYTNDMTAYDWLMFRKNYVNASENSALLGIPSYQSALAIFWDKITQSVNVKDENFRMFMGKRQEAQIADLWQYWGGDEQSVIDNYNAKKKVRKCRRVNAFIQNPEFPWLSVSVDRLINKTWHQLENGK